LIQIGSPQELYDQPHERFVADFIGDHNGIPVTVLEHRNDITISEVAGLKMITASGKSFQAGEECQVYIRPEKIEFLDQTEGRILENTFPGRVTDIIFEGALIKYSVSLAEALPPLTVSVPNVRQERPYALGSTVHVRWAPENALTL
jgi:ABC-type Fe3+/spermidine/putrescine transport system ATPase subunit